MHPLSDGWVLRNDNELSSDNRFEDWNLSFKVSLSEEVERQLVGADDSVVYEGNE